MGRTSLLICATGQGNRKITMYSELFLKYINRYIEMLIQSDRIYHSDHYNSVAMRSAVIQW